MQKRQWIGLAALMAAFTVSAGELTAKIAESHKVKSVDVWYGGNRTVFDFQGYDAWVVEPPTGVAALPGRPWTWTMQWRTAYVPRTSVPRFLQRGWCHVSIDTFQHRMDAEGLKVSAAFQKFLVEKLGFAPKACLIGMSWGGFFSTRYAANYPENVAKIYLDCPLLNFDGFGATTGGAPTQDAKRIGPWANCRRATGEWTDDPEMPVALAAKLAATKIPLLLIYGGHDQTLDPTLNSRLFLARYRRAGGEPKVVYRSLYGHHPHGVEESENTIIDFFEKDIKGVEGK